MGDLTEAPTEEAKLYLACAGPGAIQSMGRVGSALDKAADESFNSTLEWELLSRRRFATKDQAGREVAAFMDDYNHRRWHSSAEMMAPPSTSRFSPTGPSGGLNLPRGGTA